MKNNISCQIKMKNIYCDSFGTARKETHKGMQCQSEPTTHTFDASLGGFGSVKGKCWAGISRLESPKKVQMGQIE